VARNLNRIVVNVILIKFANCVHMMKDNRNRPNLFDQIMSPCGTDSSSIIVGWVVYDWSSTVTLIPFNVLFPLLINSLGDAAFGHGQGRIIWSYLTSLESAITVVLYLTATSLIEFENFKRKSLILCSLVSAFSLILFVFCFSSRSIYLASLLTITSICFQRVASVAYDSLLDSVSQGKNPHQISSRGYTTSYFGLILFVITIGIPLGIIYLIKSPGVLWLENLIPIVASGVWYLFFLSFVKRRLPLTMSCGPDLPAEMKSQNRLLLLYKAFQLSLLYQIETCLTLKEYKDILYFLIAMTFVAGASSSVSSAAVIVAQSTLKLSIVYIGISLVIGIIGGICGLIFFKYLLGQATQPSSAQPSVCINFHSHPSRNGVNSDDQKGSKSIVTVRTIKTSIVEPQSQLDTVNVISPTECAGVTPEVKEGVDEEENLNRTTFISLRPHHNRPQTAATITEGTSENSSVIFKLPALVFLLMTQPKNIVIFNAILLCLCVLAVLLISNVYQVFILSFVAGTQIAPLGSLTRSIFSRFFPEKSQSRYFSLYNLTQKALSWIGPLIIAACTQAYGSQKYLLIVVIVTLVEFGIGLPFLFAVDVSRGEAQRGGNIEKGNDNNLGSHRFDNMDDIRNPVPLELQLQSSAVVEVSEDCIAGHGNEPLPRLSAEGGDSPT